MVAASTATSSSSPIHSRFKEWWPLFGADNDSSWRTAFMTKILIVDDAQFMRMKCRNLLKGAGYEVLEAGDGVEAVRVYKEDRPDAVLLDVTMPKMDGLQTLEEIRKFDPHARVAMLTATGQQAVVREAIEAGAKDFLVKPFDDARVLEAVENLLG